MRLFVMCEQMKWSHLPVAGGLYDQHPRLLEEWNIIFTARNKKEEQDRKMEERKNKSASRSRRR
jgi:hypothetical protein